MAGSHRFHFLLDEDTARQLMAMGGFDDWKKVSPFIADLLQQFYWFIEKIHFSWSNRESRHELISPDLKDDRLHFWLPLPVGVYQRLKQVHKDLDFFSIGQVIRIVIREFLFRRYSSSGSEYEKKLVQDQKKWLASREALLATPEKISHMINDEGISREKLTRYLVIYNDSAFAMEKLAY